MDSEDAKEISTRSDMRGSILATWDMDALARDFGPYW